MFALSEVESWNIGRLSRLVLPYPGHCLQCLHLFVLWWLCYAALSVCHHGISGCLSIVCDNVIPFFHLSCSQSPTPYQTGPLWQNGMHCRIPVVLFWDDLHLGSALMGPSPVSHDEHTNPEVYLCQAVHASPCGLVLCSGCSSLSHPPGILPAFVLVVS